MTRLAKEKEKGSRDIKKEVLYGISSLVSMSMPYAFMKSKFSFDYDVNHSRRVDSELSRLKSAIIAIMMAKSLSAASVSSDKNRQKYGIDYTISEDDAYSAIDESLIDKYITQLKKESERSIAAGMMLGMSQAAIYGSIVANIKKPLMAPAVVKVFGIDRSDYGKGNYASFMGNITRMFYDVVQKAYMTNEYLSFKLSGKVAAYTVYRNSSVPCEICDQYAGKTFPMSSMILPLHPRCICGATPVMANGKELSMDV